VTVYEGRVPLHQRLVLLCQDFLESVWDFGLSDLLNFQTSLKNTEASMKPEKVDILKKVTKELFKKYQIEIVRPDVGYILEKCQTAYDKYKQEQPEQDFIRDQNSLIDFKHASYAQKVAVKSRDKAVGSRAKRR